MILRYGPRRALPLHFSSLISILRSFMTVQQRFQRASSDVFVAMWCFCCSSHIMCAALVSRWLKIYSTIHFWAGLPLEKRREKKTVRFVLNYEASGLLFVWCFSFLHFSYNETRSSQQKILSTPSNSHISEACNNFEPRLNQILILFYLIGPTILLSSSA